MELSNAERETHLSMVAQDRSIWHVYSDDPVMLRRIEAIGAKLIRIAADGLGRHYELPANQVSLRNVRKPMSEEQRARLADRMRALRQDTVNTGSENVRIDADAEARPDTSRQRRDERGDEE
jgi:hypothetical protein